MKIRHADLEEVRRDPVGWARRQGASASNRGGMSYTHLARLAIYQYHRTGQLESALAKLSEYAKAYRRTDPSRLEQAEQRVAEYVNWNEATRPTVAKVKLNVRLQLGASLFVGGEVARVDFDPLGGYRALLIDDKESDLDSELRFPVLQLAVARKIERDPSDVAIGVQSIDDFYRIEVRTFSDRGLAAAKRELDRIAREVGRVLSAS